MKCPHHEHVSAYLDDAMAPAERERFGRHLEACYACRDYLYALRAMHDRLEELPSPVLGFDLAAQFEERWRAPAADRRPGRASWLGRGFGGLAVAGSLAAGAWLGSLSLGAAVVAPEVGIIRVFSPVPPGGLCAAPEICGLPGGKP